ncbi:MAG: hypothetical protein ACK4Z4_17240, partial [Ferrovibrio sp.]
AQIANPLIGDHASGAAFPTTANLLPAHAKRAVNQFHRPALQAYWQRIKAHPVAAPVLDEVRTSWGRYQQKLQASQ